ncbi:hypothetical protein ACTBAC_004442 [Vibrio parahaemolyticus]|uniref:Uncharacterized protein n=1 Tax=Vibrio chemaguriensis TaxID=2527672 RepID=A0ABX1I3F1_9VIBR|nr:MULTISPECIES: hypothetical protein [Vibrio]EGU9323574.1 hypothetical protein [Vibrio parahaemolyticus]MDW1977351.1 hypothetical protein [Vibrio sp. Vb1980]NKJ70647.1 hypothetical protein [Vibrio chemaguriensis]
MNNRKVYKKCKKHIFSMLYKSYPKPIDIDGFNIEGRDTPKSKRKLVNYYDVMKSWESGYSSGDGNPFQEELDLYCYTINEMAKEGIISFDRQREGKTRFFYNCVLSTEAVSKTDILMFEPNFYGFGIRLKPLFDLIRRNF